MSNIKKKYVFKIKYFEICEYIMWHKNLTIVYLNCKDYKIFFIIIFLLKKKNMKIYINIPLIRTITNIFYVLNKLH